jgi:hypothetical protein
MGRKAPRKRLTCRVISAFTRVFDALWHVQRVPRTHPNVSRRSAHPSTGVSEAKRQTPGAKKRAAGTRECGLIELVRWECNPTIDYACPGCGAARSGAPLIRDRHGLERSTQVGFTCAHWAPISGKPEIGVCKKTGKYRDRTNQRGARVFGSLILRRREAPSRRMRRAIPLPSCFETHRSALRRAKQPALAMLLCMRGKGARRILAKRTQLRFWPTQGSF